MTEDARRPGLPAAVLWDMDGTLVDTEPYWSQCSHALVARHGGVWTEADEVAVLGSSIMVTARRMQQRVTTPLSADQIVGELLDDVVAMVEAHVPWRPGARELLGALGEEGVPCALVTNSWWRFAQPVLRQLPDAAFDAVVTGDLVDAGKPHPEPYLRAATELQVSPAHTVAIEDSATGAASAEAAGCLVLVVPHHVEVPLTERRVRRDSLVGLTPRHLGELLPG